MNTLNQMFINLHLYSFNNSLIFPKNDMKTKKESKYITILLLLAGGFYSCQSESDIDMSQIDFSNIEKLYEQPLPVIQKCVQGKWKVYSSCSSGIIYNVTYPENSFIEFKDDYYIKYNEDGSQSITYFTWEKHVIEDWRSPLNGYKTYMMCDKNQEDAISSKLYFKDIHNDTLSFGTCIASVGYSAVKVK